MPNGKCHFIFCCQFNCVCSERSGKSRENYHRVSLPYTITACRLDYVDELDALKQESESIRNADIPDDVMSKVTINVWSYQLGFYIKS